MQPGGFSRFGFGATCVIATLMFVSAGARAQVPGPGDQNKYSSPRVAGEASEVRLTEARLPEWGTTSPIILRLGSSSFSPSSSDQNWEVVDDWLRGTNSSQPVREFVASIPLPSGALFTSFAAEVADDSVGANIDVSLDTCPNLVDWCGPSPTASTSGTPGLTWITKAFYPPVIIDNNANSYFVRVSLGSGDSQTRLRSIVIYYQLQVSPAPSVATFSDVPTSHPFFKFVEALSASGITAGCGGGKFCPDAPLTRGQMAVFLSAALGLYWEY